MYRVSPLKEIALYDGIKQGAFARYFDKKSSWSLSCKKIYLDASETELTGLTQLCIEAAVGERICEERPGVRRMRKKALEDILDQEYETLPSYDKLLDRLKIAVFRDVLTGSVQPTWRKTVCIPGSDLCLRRKQRHHGTDSDHRQPL